MLLFQGGFIVELGKLLGILHLQRFHCFAHKLNLIVRNTANAKESVTQRIKFSGVKLREKDANAHHSFHSKSSKNMAHLREVMVEAGKNPVKPLKIHEVRWSSSHREVLRREYVHAPIWWEHYARISSSDSFSQTQREKASYLQDAIEDKNARLISVFLLDILIFLFHFLVRIYFCTVT